MKMRIIRSFPDLGGVRYTCVTQRVGEAFGQYGHGDYFCLVRLDSADMVGMVSVLVEPGFHTNPDLVANVPDRSGKDGIP